MPPFRLSAPALGLVSILTLAAGPTSASAQSAGPVRLEARPASLSLIRGESARVQVVALDASGTPVDGVIRLAGPRRDLRVEGDRITGLEVGEHTLRATLARTASEPLELEIPVVVRWPPIARVQVTGPAGAPRPPVAYEGTTIRLGARAFHGDGSSRDEAAVDWSTADPEVASIDRFGNLTAHRPGVVEVTARAEGVSSTARVEIRPFPAVTLALAGGADQGADGEPVRTGDVLSFRAVARDREGRVVDGLPVTWSLGYQPTNQAETGARAPAQIVDGSFVADVPGIHTVLASAGPLTARAAFEVAPRDVVRELDLVGYGTQNRIRTTDFWVFEGLDGRDYVITGSKRADGHAFVFDVTDPANIVKTDSVQVDARAVNDVKVSPDGRYATMTREGASDRKNGVVILDLADPAHPVIASEITDRLTGGVHNAFPTETHVFALSNGDKYVILDVGDIYAPRIVSEYDHPDSRVHDVWVRNGLAFSAEWGTGVVVVDVGDGRWGGSIENPVFVTSYALPTGGTHAVFPYEQPETGRYYLFVGDEIMNRRGLAWAGYPRSMGSYADRYDPSTGQGGIPLTTRGYIQIVDFTDPERPQMVARYQVPEFGTHNIWVEDDVLYQAYYEGGLRVVDVSGPLMGNLYTQGREMAVFKSADPAGYTPNATMVWSAMPHKGHIFFTDTNSGLWAVKMRPRERPVS